MARLLATAQEGYLVHARQYQELRPNNGEAIVGPADGRAVMTTSPDLEKGGAVLMQLQGRHMRSKSSPEWRCNAQTMDDR